MHTLPQPDSHARMAAKEALKMLKSLLNAALLAGSLWLSRDRHSKDTCQQQTQTLANGEKLTLAESITVPE